MINSEWWLFPYLSQLCQTLQISKMVQLFFISYTIWPCLKMVYSYPFQWKKWLNISEKSINDSRSNGFRGTKHLLHLFLETPAVVSPNFVHLGFQLHGEAYSLRITMKNDEKWRVLRGKKHVHLKSKILHHLLWTSIYEKLWISIVNVHPCCVCTADPAVNFPPLQAVRCPWASVHSQSHCQSNRSEQSPHPAKSWNVWNLKVQEIP